MQTVQSPVQRCMSPDCKGVVRSVQVFHEGSWKIRGQCLSCNAMQDRFCCDKHCANISKFKFENQFPELQVV